MTYTEKLTAIKREYPFDRMREYWQEADEHADVAALQQAFDGLIAELIELGPDAADAEKIARFQQAIETTNDHDGVIETGEREDLCELTNQISLACGLNPEEYGSGEGLASEWRDW